jgi:hypothetical protein
VDFARVLRGVLQGAPVEQRPDPACRTLIRMFPQSMFNAIDERRPGDLLKALADFPLDDPMLAGAALRRVLTHYLPAQLRRHGPMPASAATH